MWDTEMLEIVKKNVSLLDHVESFHYILQKLESVILLSDLPILEIGTNMGGSMKCFMEVLLKNGKNNWCFSVDPYGAIKYHNGSDECESARYHKSDICKTSIYDNKKYRNSMKLLHSFAADNNLNYCHNKCTSEEFMSNIFPTLNTYDSGVIKKVDKFSFVFLDGSHDPVLVKKELEFFMNYIDINGCIIVDDLKENERRGVDGALASKNKPNEPPIFVDNKTQIHERYVVEYREIK